MTRAFLFLELAGIDHAIAPKVRNLNSPEGLPIGTSGAFPLNRRPSDCEPDALNSGDAILNCSRKRNRTNQKANAVNRKR